MTALEFARRLKVYGHTGFTQTVELDTHTQLYLASLIEREADIREAARSLKSEAAKRREHREEIEKIDKILVTVAWCNVYLMAVFSSIVAWRVAIHGMRFVTSYIW